MKYKTKYIISLIVIVLILLLTLLWNYLQKEDSAVLNFECGQKLALDNYLVFTKAQVTETIAELMNTSNSGNFISNTLNNQQYCFKHAALPSQGYFVVNTIGKNYILQATHAHDDLHTGEILKLIMQNEAAAKYATLSSVNRQVLDSSTQESLSNSVSRNLVVEHELAAIIQLHGFSQEKRRSRIARTANMIISSGTKDSNFIANSIYQCLEQRFDHVFLYGKNIYELGATENKLLAQLQADAYEQNFIHIELSLEQRKKLLNADDALKFSQCFLQGDLNVSLA